MIKKILFAILFSLLPFLANPMNAGSQAIINRFGENAKDCAKIKELFNSNIPTVRVNDPEFSDSDED